MKGFAPSLLALVTVPMLSLFLSACATQSGNEAVQEYQVPAKEREAVTAFSQYKQRTLAEIGSFDFDRRFTIYTALDEIAYKLWHSPKRIMKNTTTNTVEKYPILELSDRDLDGQPDQFSYLSEEGGTTQHFGFFFDLNKDGRVDYLVFNGGPMFTEQKGFYWMNYHWIDSNYDGLIDIEVNNAVNPETGKGPPKPGLTAWLYDSNHDGHTDRAEYISKEIVQSVPEKDGVLTVNWLLENRDITVGRNSLSGFEKLLADINAAIR